MRVVLGELLRGYDLKCMTVEPWNLQDVASGIQGRGWLSGEQYSSIVTAFSAPRVLCGIEDWSVLHPHCAVEVNLCSAFDGGCGAKPLSPGSSSLIKLCCGLFGIE